MSILVVRRGIQGPRGLSGLAARETLVVAANIEAISTVADNIDAIIAADFTADDTSYDHATSGLTAVNVQTAIDEITLNMNSLSSIRVGEIISGIWAEAPEGTLALVGQTGLLRSTYSALFNHLNSLGLLATEATKTVYQFGDGNGTTTFSMPDWRGQFFRNVGGVRGLASYQADAYKSHTHTATVTDPGHAHTLHTLQGTAAASIGGLGNTNPGIFATDAATTGISIDNAPSGDTESRPVNIALLYCIVTG